MKTDLIIRNFAACMLLAFFPNLLWAQEGVARIDKIATVTKGVIDEMKDQTSLARLQRNKLTSWHNVKLNDELYFNDKLKLEENIRLRIKVKNRIQNGSLIFTPHPDLKEPGIYEVKEMQDERPGLIAIEIQQGSAIFSVKKNVINTATHGLLSLVEQGSTTRALFHVRPDSSGEIYLQKGNVTFPEDPGATHLKPGEVAYFRDGKILRIVVPATGLVNEYEDFIKLNSSTIWKPPLIKRPVFWIGVAAVGAGITGAILAGKKENKVTGNVVVNWGGN